MAVSLGYWAPSGGAPGRVYVNGMPGTGPGTKVHLKQARGGRIVMVVTGDTVAVSEDAVLAAARAAAPELDMGWDAFVSAVQAQPPRRRGPAPGTKASSRPGYGQAWGLGNPIPGAADFEAVTPEMAANPIPEPTTIVVDHREPGIIADLLRTVANLQVEVGELDTGDYQVRGHLVIERKTAEDFVQSVVEDEKRLFHQTHAMGISGMQPIVILEGDPYAQGRMGIKNVDGTLSYLMAIHRIPVFQTRTPAHTAEVIAKLVRHTVHGLGYPDPATKASGAPQDPRAAAAYMLTCIPGVSSTLAARLLAAFGSIQGVALAEPAALRGIEGVGPAVAAKIMATMRPG